MKTGEQTEQIEEKSQGVLIPKPSWRGEILGSADSQIQIAKLPNCQIARRRPEECDPVEKEKS